MRERRYVLARKRQTLEMAAETVLVILPSVFSATSLPRFCLT